MYKVNFQNLYGGPDIELLSDTNKCLIQSAVFPALQSEHGDSPIESCYQHVILFPLTLSSRSLPGRCLAHF